MDIYQLAWDEEGIRLYLEHSACNWEVEDSSSIGNELFFTQYKIFCFHNNMMTSSNGNIFRVTGHLCGEFTGHRWIPRTKASDAELWYFLLICAWINGWVNNGQAGELKRHRAHYDVTVMHFSSCRLVLLGVHSMCWTARTCTVVIAAPRTIWCYTRPCYNDTWDPFNIRSDVLS